MSNNYHIGFYHGYNGHLVSATLYSNSEYIAGYDAGMKAEDEKIERESRMPAPAYIISN